MQALQLQVQITRQEDGLWRAEVPGVPGCFVDAPSVSEALRDIQAVAAMFADLYRESDRDLPESMSRVMHEGFTASIPLGPEEHVVRRPRGSRARSGIR